MRAWHLRDLWTEPPSGHLSVPKTWTNLGGLALTAALLIAVRNRDVSFDVMVGYSIALLMLAVPTMGAKIIGLKWGRRADPDPTTPASAPAGGQP